METEFTIPRLLSGGVITNYFCTSACAHCLYRCSPAWPGDYLDEQNGFRIMEIIFRSGCRRIHIGGGEPMLRPEKLEKILDAARNAGVGVEYAETNSSWFKDLPSAVHLLKGLKARGLNRLLISISPFHNAHIPFRKVLGVMEACRASGVDIFPWTEDFIRDLSAFDPETPHGLSEYMEKFGRNYPAEIPSRYWIHMGGRAVDAFRECMPGRPLDEILESASGGCGRELTDTSHFHIDLYGNYIPGLCSGLSLYMEDLGASISDMDYPLLTTLFRTGIRGLYFRAEKEIRFHPRRGRYVNKCDLCQEIRACYVRKTIVKPKELQPRYFYTEILNTKTLNTKTRGATEP